MHTDPLAIAMTKPVTAYGVPQKLLMLELFISLLVLLYGNKLFEQSIAGRQYSFIFAAILGILTFIIFFKTSQLIARSDPGRFNVIWIGFNKTPPLKNFRFWGKTNSYGAN